MVETRRELVITHTYADGTTLYGTRREDDLYKLLRGHGWLYRRSVGDFRLQGSVDKPAKRGVIECTAAALRERGFHVEVEIGTEMRSSAAAEADRTARASARADRLEERAGRAADAADGHYNAEHQILDHIPPGQPILVGHHSERGHRRALKRAESHRRKGSEQARLADSLTSRAEAARNHMAYRHTPITVVNRIRKLEKELRDVQARLTSDRLTTEYRQRLAEEAEYLIGQLTHWREVRAGQVAAGVVTEYGRDTISRGDLVRTANRWYPVVRANKVSVTVPSMLGNWTDTARYDHITDHVRPGDDRWNDTRIAALEMAHRLAGPTGLHPAFQALTA